MYSKGLNPSYVLPSRSTITRMLPNKYEDIYNKVKDELSSIEYMTLTTDMWTSQMKTESYLALTAHFVSQDWKLKTVLLECSRFVGPHCGEDIKRELLKICQRLNVADKIHAIVSDNGSNIKAAIHSLGWSHFPCLAHTLNLVVKDALLVIEPIRLKTKSIVAHFHKSTSSSDKFKDMQQSMAPARSTLSSPIYVLINDVETRWNSTYYMFERLYQVRDPLVAAIAVLQQKNANLQSLDAADFDLLKELLEILKPFELVTTELSAEKNVSGSKTLLMLRELKKRMRTFVNNGSKKPESQAISQFLLDGLNARFPILENNLLLSISTFLDPRFKKRGITDPTALQYCKKELHCLIVKMIEKENYDVPPADAVVKPAADSFWASFDAQNESAISNITPTTSATIEIRQYNEEPAIDRHSDPFDWWQKRENVYPHLAKLAKRYFSMVATSVPSERVFSTAGELVSKKRNRLSSEHIECIMFLNGNKSFL